jgi:hypothetical protein
MGKLRARRGSGAHWSRAPGEVRVLRRRESVRQPTGQSRIGGSAQPRVQRAFAGKCVCRATECLSKSQVCVVFYSL